MELKQFKMAKPSVGTMSMDAHWVWRDETSRQKGTAYTLFAILWSLTHGEDHKFVAIAMKAANNCLNDDLLTPVEQLN